MRRHLMHFVELALRRALRAPHKVCSSSVLAHQTDRQCMRYIKDGIVVM